MSKVAAISFDYINQKNNHVFHFPITIFKKPATEKEAKHLQKILDKLIDEVRDDENHPLALVMQIIGENLEAYDDAVSEKIGGNINEVAFVKYLMESRNALQKDLAPIFGAQGNVSKFLNGERPLSKNQIAGLKEFFHISADFFI